LRNVEEAPTTEQRDVHGGGLVSLRVDGTEEVALDQLGISGGGGGQRHEDHAAPDKIWRDGGRRRGGSALTKCRPHVLKSSGRSQAIRLLERRVGLEVQGLEVDLLPVLIAPCIRQAHTLEHAEGIEPAGAQPLRFAVKSAQL